MAKTKKTAKTNKTAKTRAARVGTLAKKAGLRTAVVDKALAGRWSEVIGRLHSARSEAAKGWDDKYEAVDEILEHSLYLAGGYKSAREFITRELPGEDERSVRTYVRVARYFDPADEDKYGISRLDLLLNYLEAAGGAPLAPAKINLGSTKVKVPGKAGAHRMLAFGDATTDELRLAARAARSGKSTPAAKEPPAVKALRAHLVKAGVRGVGVRLRRDRFDLSGVPRDALAKVGKALLAAKLPA